MKKILPIIIFSLAILFLVAAIAVLCVAGYQYENGEMNDIISGEDAPLLVSIWEWRTPIKINISFGLSVLLGVAFSAAGIAVNQKKSVKLCCVALTIVHGLGVIYAWGYMIYLWAWLLYFVVRNVFESF